MDKELHLKYRPKEFADVAGQNDAVKILQSFVKEKRIPHALLFVGPTGVGKTSLARIIVRKLRCSRSDFNEINAADFRGIDTIRDIRSRMNLAPIGGKTRVWLLDEASQMSSQAQNSFLKILEEPPNHVYFMLATTDPKKLLSTIRGRCTIIGLSLLRNEDLSHLVASVCKKEGLEVSEEVHEKIVDHANGSARQSLVLLGTVAGLEGEEEQLDAIEKSDIRRQAIELVRTLLNPKVRWKQIASILKDLDEEPETLRRMILDYTSKVMLGGTKVNPRAEFIVESFLDNFYDSGRAGLIVACSRVMRGES